jgi:hypothetical protein
VVSPSAPLVRHVRTWGLAGLAALTLACHHDPWERACPDRDGCDDDEVCQQILGYPSYSASHSVCAPRCSSDEECPAPDFGDAAPACQATDVCALRCGKGTTCPAGMVCADQACMFPR